MTRLNLFPVDLLCDQHLGGEHKEICRVGTQLLDRFNKGQQLDKGIPPRFTLNKGHQSFFLDKGAYIHRRCVELYAEVLRRQREPNINVKCQWYPEAWEKVPEFYQMWAPVTADYEIVIERLAKMLPEEPRYQGKAIDRDDAYQTLKDWLWKRKNTPWRVMR